MKFSPRSQRLSGVLEEIIPPILQELFSPDDVGFLTITAVEVSGDLGVADIFVRSIGGPDNFLKKLQARNSHISREILGKVKLRRPVILRFKQDKSVSLVEKISEFKG